MPNPFETKNTNIAPSNDGAIPVDTRTKYQPNIEGQRDFLFSNMGTPTPIFTGDEREYESLSAYGAQPNNYQTISELEKIRAKNQSAWKQAFNSLAQATGQVIGDTVGGFGMLADIITGAAFDDELYSNFITRAGDSISEAARQNFPIYRENPEEAFDFNDFSGWFFSQLPSVASSLSLMIPAGAATKGLSMIGRGALKGLRTSSKVNRAINKAEKLLSLDNVYNAQKAKAILETGVSSIGMRLGENYQEARGVAEQITEEALNVFSDMDASKFNKWLQENPDIAAESDGTKEGTARVIAEKAADRDFAYNTGNVVFDYMQLRALGNATRGLISKTATPSVRYAQREALNRMSSAGISSTGEATTKELAKATKDIGSRIIRGINASKELVVSELTEGIEEAINFVGQEEGTAYGRYLLDKVNSDYSGKAFDVNRIENYLHDPQLYNSALWGVLGGVIFGGTMNTINNAITKRKGGMTEDQQRIAEINGREQVFNQYQNQIQTIREGYNPYEFNDDGSNPQINETEQQELINEARNRFTTTLTLNAINAGNYELLEEYINSPQLRKKLIDSGFAEAETYDADTKAIIDSMRKTAESYKKYSSILQSANVNDAFLDIAIRENIFNEQEANLLQERVDRINVRQEELRNVIPELKAFDPITETGVRLDILRQAKTAIDKEIAKLDKNKAQDRITLNQLEERRKAIEELENRDNLLFAPEGNLNDIIQKEVNAISKEEQEILDRYFGATSPKNLNQLYDISPEYVENLQQSILDEVRQIAYTDRIVTSNEDVVNRTNQIKEELQEAANEVKTNAENTLIQAIDNATEEDYDEVNRAIKGQATEQDLTNPKLKAISDAVTTLTAASDDINTFNEIIDRELDRAKERVVQSSSTNVNTPSTTTNVITKPTSPISNNNNLNIRDKLDSILELIAPSAKGSKSYNLPIITRNRVINEIKAGLYRGREVYTVDEITLEELVKRIENYLKKLNKLREERKEIISNPELKGRLDAFEFTRGIEASISTHVKSIYMDLAKAYQILNSTTSPIEDGKSNISTSSNPISNDVVVDKEAVNQINEIVDKLVGENAPIIITEGNINDFNINIKGSFTSSDIMTGEPVKIKNIKINIGRFGDVSIDGFSGAINNRPNADVTLEDINNAIANGSIEVTPKENVRESTIVEGIDPAKAIIDGISKLQERQEEIKLIFSLYAKAVANESVNNKPIISLEGLMRFIQDNNPRAINLLNDIKNVALMLNRNGDIILNDSQEVINSNNQDLTKRIIESPATQIRKTLKETTQVNSSFGIQLDNPFGEQVDAKLYSTIMNLKKGDKVTLKISNTGELEVHSGKNRIGKIPVPSVDINGNPQVNNEHWTYTSIKDNNRYDIPFIEELKNIVSSDNESDKDLISNIYKIKAIINSIRTNPENRSLLNEIINSLENNSTYKRLVSIYSNPLTEFEDKLTRANHIAKILMYDRNLNPNTTNYAELVGESLNQWEQKVGYNYNIISNTYNNIAKTKSQSKRISIADTSTGRLLLNNDTNGTPRYSNINSVLRSIDTDNYALYGIENGQIIIRDGSNRVVGQSEGLYDNGNTILYVEDSQGRKIRVNTQGNTANNGLTSDNDFVRQFNNGIIELFDGLAKSLLNRDNETFNSIVPIIEQYIGNGKMLYGYEFSRDREGNVIFKPRGTFRGVSEKFNGPTIYFNIASEYPNIKFRYPDGTTTPAMGITTSRGENVAASSRKNFNKRFPELFNYLRRNIINEAFSGDYMRGNQTIENTEDGKVRFKIPSINNDKWFDQTFDSYNDFIINTGVLVTNVDAVRDSKGNIIGNFTFTNEGFNSIGLNKNIYLTLEQTSPVKEQETTKSAPATDVLRNEIESGTTPTKLGKSIGINSSYESILKSLEDAGLRINTNIENNPNRLASIPVGENVLTLTNEWFKLDANQKVLKVVHEGIHYYFVQEGVDISKFNDLYDKFKEFITNPEVNETVRNTYNKYLNETKSRDVAVEEFVVEALTSREFARLLSSIPYTSADVSTTDNIFTNIVNAIVELIGKVSGIDNTILGEIRNRLSTIGEVNTGEDITNDIINNVDEVVESIEDIDDAFTSDFGDIDGINFDSSIIDSDAKLTPTMASLFSRLNAAEQRSLASLDTRDEINYTCA